MRVLFTVQPGYGHLHPLVPLAGALAGAGHEVAVACAAAFAPTVTASGLRAIPAGLDWLVDWLEDKADAAAMAAAVPDWSTRPARGPARAAWIGANVWAGVTAGRMTADLLSLAAAWPFDLVVRETNELGGCLAAERLGLPHAVVQIVAPWPGDGAEAPLAAPLAGHRAALGLPPDPALAMLRRYLHLSARPPSFRIAPPGPTDHAYRAPLFDRSVAGAAPGWVSGPLAPPVVYATLGTVVNRAVPGLFAAILAGTRDAAGTLVLTVGTDVDPAALGPQPPHVHVERYVPQTDLLPRCDLVVTHGGSGTLLAALAHGLPAVVIPVAADQPRNAARVAALGLGRVVEPEERTAAAIGAAVRAVLGDPAYRARARACQAEMGALPGVEHAVALLERLGAGRQPILRSPDCP